jgi:branched-subunit amino acid aminotransferase/4-amino-4-deoxychorismate lyase
MPAAPIDEKLISKHRPRGVRGVLIEGYRPQIPGIKTLNYLPNVLAAMEAKKRGALEGIFKGPDGSLLEGTASNLFVVEQGVLKTHPVNENPLLSGVLPGVMRKAVIELAGRLGIHVMAVRTTEDGLKACDEAFLTNSIAGIIPLIAVDSVELNGGKPGPMTARLQDSLETMRS